jgi:hypothetical protein
MSGSATEVSGGATATKTLSSRRRPALIGAAIAGVGLIIVIAAVALHPSASPPAVSVAPASGVPAPTTVIHEPPPPAPTLEPPPPAEPAPAPKPERVIVEVSSDPSGAEVWLPDDKEARGRTPFKVLLDPAAAPMRVVLKARGYTDRGLDLDPAKPEPMSVTLERIARDRDHVKRKGSEGIVIKKPNKDGYRMMGD